MKSTGIVRRIDDLGRVVIPKDIRRHLNICDGDPLEVYVDKGMVIYKKYSPLFQIDNIAKNFAEVLNDNINRPIIVTDKDYIVAVSGVSKREYLERPISVESQNIINNRQPYYLSNNNNEIIKILNDKKSGALILHPIISNDDIVGSIVVIKDDDSKEPTELECKLVQNTAELLGKQIEY